MSTSHPFHSVDLFHCGVGASRECRYVVISIHSDGFEYISDFNDVPQSFIPARQCRPWFHRTDHPSSPEDSTLQGELKSASYIHSHVDKQTKQGKAQIEALIDQPGTCIRDEVDKVDFKELDGQDLSEIDPPGIGDEDGSWMLVDSVRKMKQCVQELEESFPTEIAFDMEMYNASKYTQVTCLIQITSNTAEKEYVIDTLAPGVWEHVPLLRRLFADPSIVKIGHSIGGLDVHSLHRDFGIFVVNAFDTYEAAKQLKLAEGLGLAKVCASYGLAHVEEFKRLKELYQKTDWRVRPLSDEMIQYGRYDIHFLTPLRRLMIRDLTREELWDNVGSNKDAERRMIAKALASTIRRIEREEDGLSSNGTTSMDFDNVSSADTSMDVSRISSLSDDDGYFTPPTEEDPTNDVTRQSIYDAIDLRMQADLMRVITRSQQRCLDLWTVKNENPRRNDTYVSILYRAGKGELEWSSSHTALYENLVHWRHDVAKKEQVLPGLVCDLDWLVLIALKRPSCETSLRRITYYLPHLVEDAKDIYLKEILFLVRSSLEKDGLSTASTLRKYKAPSRIRKVSRAGRITLSLGAVVVIGAVATVVIAGSRKRR